MKLGKLLQAQVGFPKYINAKLKRLRGRIAIVGTRTAAEALLRAIDLGGINFLGIYEVDPDYKPGHELLGHKVKPLTNLARLKPTDTIVIASSQEAEVLYETIHQIENISRAKVIHFKSLMDVYMLHDELHDLLKFDFGEFLFWDGLFLEKNWHPLPPKVSFKNKIVLELGPYEGNQTVMLARQNPAKIIAIESRPINYAKTSLIRSMYNFQNFELILGDMHLFPQLVKDKIDIIFCSGVLYHSSKPWWLLENCLKHADTVVVSGHVSSAESTHAMGFQTIELESGSYEFEIQPEFGWEDNRSGVATTSLWFKEEDLIRFAKYYGFNFKKYDSTVNKTGLWISAVLKRIKKRR
ncbi:MAG: DUF1698 domain-containing protein [Candidatus Nitrohelix vancouverensis]|uniref:DUF1698 domain-containing protein n=1 Tax=Candidatus Nitrohelix vancouverensis TaxID=2705534 RepID=A0A7T0C2K5_9BACT|nr:MAG: DUF1698 domain-containing protein [Candidatus Nitrohelix vancouverensis]